MWLAAFADDQPLSPEAAAQLERLMNDPTIPGAVGREMPTVDESVLLAREERTPTVDYTPETKAALEKAVASKQAAVDAVAAKRAADVALAEAQERAAAAAKDQEAALMQLAEDREAAKAAVDADLQVAA